MFAKSISRRWFVNTIGVVLVVLVIFVRPCPLWSRAPPITA